MAIPDEMTGTPVHGLPYIDAADDHILAKTNLYQRALAEKVEEVLTATYGRVIGEDPRHYGGVGDGDTNDTAAIEAARDAALVSGLPLIIPAGTWVTDPIDIYELTVLVWGTLRLRAQAASELPAAHGVLYSYGTSEAHRVGPRIIGFGGKIDGNRENISGPGTVDMEGVNFKYVDGGLIEGLEVFNAFDSGIDIDNSTGCVISNNYAHDCRGYGFHLSNGAIGNLIIGNLAENNGHAFSRGGFDQYDGTEPKANANRYIGNVGRGNYRNYNIGGQTCVFFGNLSEDGDQPDEVTAANVLEATMMTIGDNALLVTSGGRVAMGRSSANAGLHVQGPSGVSIARFTSSVGTDVVDVLGGGDLEVLQSARGLVLRDFNGDRWRITINSEGELVTTNLSSS